MGAANQSPAIDSEVPDVLDDLVRETLRTLLPVTLLLAWLWLAADILRSGSRLAPAYLVLGILLAAAVASYRLAGDRLRLAVATYVIALFAAVTVVADTYRAGSSLYLYILVILVTGMLSDARALVIASIASSALLLAIGLKNATPLADGLLVPIVYVLLTALMAASTIVMLPTVIVFFFAQRLFIQGGGADRLEGLARGDRPSDFSVLCCETAGMV